MWLESLPLQAVNAHKVGSAQWPSSNLETKVISMGKKKGGVPLTDYVILSEKESRMNSLLEKLWKGGRAFKCLIGWSWKMGL